MGAEILFLCLLAQGDFWSFRPLAKPAAPAVRDTRQRPASIADRRILLRRLSFDLTGLPASPEQPAETIEQTVDRLLASPQFGERWGRHWLDVARYAEDDVRGLAQESYPNAWRYRDWVIAAFNNDLPYDQFVKAQIAADLLPGREHLPALGFLGLGPWYYDIAVPTQARADERHERVDAITRGFLGLTGGCARCHDHKFDPITMRDYYGLAGVFASTEYREYPLVEQRVADEYARHQKKIKDQEAAIKDYLKGFTDRLAEVLARRTPDYVFAAYKVLGPSKRPVAEVAAEAKLDRETLDRWVAYLGKPGWDHPYLKAWEAQMAAPGDPHLVAEEFSARLAAVTASKKSIDEENRLLMAAVEQKKSRRTNLPNGFVTYEDFCGGCRVQAKALPRDDYTLWDHVFGGGRRPDGGGSRQGVLVYDGKSVERWIEGEWKSHLERLRAELDALKKAAPPPYPFLHGVAESAQPGNLKLHLRGSPFQLGEETPRRFLTVLSPGGPASFTNGSGRLELAEAIAAHPLAARVMANRVWHWLFGHGLVSTPSNLGRSGHRPSDPEMLEYLAWRFAVGRYSMKALIREIVLSVSYQQQRSPRRLDAEALRDSMLAVSGKLDARLGGPSVDLATDQARRSAYGKVSRFRLNQTLALFDFPEPGSSCEQRNVTLTPLQRLFYLNSDFVIQQAAALAERLEKETGADSGARLRRAYRLLFSRDPVAAELARGLRFLADGGSWPQLAQALLSSNEFGFLD